MFTLGLVVSLISSLLLFFKRLFHNKIVWNFTFKIFHHKPKVTKTAKQVKKS